MATVIGDVVASREHADRAGLQRGLGTVLEAVNEAMQPLQPLQVSVGDEFQGAFASVGTAAHASLLLRLLLWTGPTQVDSRYGLGLGAVTVFDPDRVPVSQDGPGWWAAREAIGRAKQLAGSPRSADVRTYFDAPDALSELAPMVNAFLICRDGTVGRMSERGRRLVLEMMRGRTQLQMAELEGITQSAVSQNLRASGAFGLLMAHDLLVVAEPAPDQPDETRS